MRIRRQRSRIVQRADTNETEPRTAAVVAPQRGRGDIGCPDAGREEFSRPLNLLAEKKTLSDETSSIGFETQNGVRIGPELGAQVTVTGSNHERLVSLTEVTHAGGFLAEGLRQACQEAGVPAQVNQIGSMWTLFFAAGAVTDYDSAKKADTACFARFFWAMLDRGVYLPCSQFEAAFNSVLHTRERLRETAAAAREALGEIAREGAAPP